MNCAFLLLVTETGTPPIRLHDCFAASGVTGVGNPFKQSAKYVTLPVETSVVVNCLYGGKQ